MLKEKDNEDTFQFVTQHLVCSPRGHTHMSDFFGPMKHARIFWGRQKKTEGFFWVVEKGLRDVSLFSGGGRALFWGGGL